MRAAPILLASFALAGSASGFAAAPADHMQPREEVAIPFASRDIIEWKVDGDRGLYIRSLNGKWYYARTASRCNRLAAADNGGGLGFETRGADQLDKYGAIRAQGWLCPLESVTLSDPPARKKKAASAAGN